MAHSPYIEGQSAVVAVVQWIPKHQDDNHPTFWITIHLGGSTFLTLAAILNAEFGRVWFTSIAADAKTG
ncbi:MAG TPA: hypothetical protein EYG57_13190 [Planctomycetes bacterium]|jgi:hypothetical protein|nr:hypothetical protein [Planctomycetota bacterium]